MHGPTLSPQTRTICENLAVAQSTTWFCCSSRLSMAAEVTAPAKLRQVARTLVLRTSCILSQGQRVLVFSGSMSLTSCGR